MSELPLSTKVKSILCEFGYGHCADLPYGKYLYQDVDGSAFVKASSDESGMALIRSEIRGLQVISPWVRDVVTVPTGTVLLDDADGVVLKSTRVDGEPASKWSKSVVHLTPSLASAQSIMSLTDLLANESVDINLSCHLVERFGDVDLKVTPSHGDFIYWNVLVGGEQPSLVDFEYVSECRVIGFDDLHFRFAPWMHRWIRWRLPEQLLIWWGLRQARFVCRQNHLSMEPELLLAMFFIHWAAIRRQPHLQFDLYPIERIENWATLV